MPVASAVVGALTREPHVEEAHVAGVPTTIAGTGPAIVLVNGATPLGRRHPRIRRLALGLARAGHLVLVPDVPGLARGEITAAGVAATAAVARDAASRSDGRAALFGISAGATLALLAAEEEELAGAVSLIAGVAPYTDLTDLIRLATTGVHRVGDRLVPYQAGPFLQLCVARSVAAGLDPGPDRDALVAELSAVAIDDPDPLAGLRARDASALGPAARAAVALLANRDPDRFDVLYRELPPILRERIDRLSPVLRADRLRCPVELFSHPRDKYFPLEHSRALVRRAPNARLTVSSTFAHADARLSAAVIADAARFLGFAVRSLRAARFG